MSNAENKPATPSKPAGKTEPKSANKAEVKPVAKTETKPADTAVVNAGVKPADKVESKPIVKAEFRQAGKGSKRRPFNAKQFGANYASIRWSRGQSQRPKH